ncbi:MAG: alkaline phosphatase family protein [Clostridiales bacterium]|jgi:predicted AlkP superfamily pyrophosphatase or phosphodiesterase|nr:alkaline phosphatase family protein [Clostridiales bacterium]
MNNKIVLLLADGMRPDFVLGCGSPFADEFLKMSRYSLKARTVMPSITLPCHMSLFHSVPPERHGILSNTWAPQVRPVNGLCEVLTAAGKRTAFVYDWPQLRDLTRPGNLGLGYFFSGGAADYYQSAAKIAEGAVNFLRRESFDFMFIYIGLPDEIGHKFGFAGTEYREAVNIVWGYIKTIYENLPEHASMIVTADHGGHGRGHGTDIPEDMTIPVIFYGDAFQPSEGTSPADLPCDINIIDLAPTIVAALGVSPDPDWEGRRLI